MGSKKNKLSESRTNQAQIGQFSPQLGQFSPQIGQFSPQIGQFSPQTGQFSPQIRHKNKYKVEQINL